MGYWSVYLMCGCVCVCMCVCVCVCVTTRRMGEVCSTQERLKVARTGCEESTG